MNAMIIDFRCSWRVLRVEWAAMKDNGMLTQHWRPTSVQYALEEGVPTPPLQVNPQAVNPVVDDARWVTVDVYEPNATHPTRTITMPPATRTRALRLKLDGTNLAIGMLRISVNATAGFRREWTVVHMSRNVWALTCEL